MKDERLVLACPLFLNRSSWMKKLIWKEERQNQERHEMTRWIVQRQGLGWRKTRVRPMDWGLQDRPGGDHKMAIRLADLYPFQAGRTIDVD